MNNSLEQLAREVLEAAAGRGLLALALQQFYAFLLVLIRLSGLMIVGPIFGQQLVPAHVRILLVLAAALLMTPTLSRQASLGFVRLDADQDGRLTRAEIPPPLADRFEAALLRAGKTRDGSVTADEFRAPLQVPAGVLDFARGAVRELTLGFLLGLGVLIVLSALQLAGELIDQQSGLGLSEVFSPGFEMSASVSSQSLFLLGTAVFLVMEPVGGHLLLIAALVETFQTLPVGEPFVVTPAIEFARDLVHQSLVLAVQLAAPMLATMSLVALATGYLGHSVPQVNVLVIGFALRALVNLLVLAVVVSGAARIVVDAVPQAIDHMRSLLTGLT